MQLFIIMFLVLWTYQFLRGPSEARTGPDDDLFNSRQNDQIENLKARMTVLEEILLDRDRQLRNKFRGL